MSGARDPDSSRGPDMDTEAFISAWRAWDQRPGDTSRAGRFEDQCSILAAYLEITPTRLRIDLAAAIEAGGRVEAVEALMAAYGKDPS